MLLNIRLKFIKSFIIYLLNLMTNVCIQVISIIPFYIIANKIENPLISGLVLNIIALVLMCIITIYFPMNNFYQKVEKYQIEILKYLVLCGTIVVILMIQYKTSLNINIVSYSIYTILICTIIVIVFGHQKYRYELKQKNLEVHMHKLYVKAFEGMLESIRIRQHDFKNQLAAIYGMHLTATSLEELIECQREYCDYLINESRYDSIITKCNDKILAGFLYTKLCEAEKVGIEIEFNILVEHLHYKIEIYEIIEVIGILIDNAIEYNTDKQKRIYFELTKNKISYVLSAEMLQNIFLLI